jgi:cytochrome c-type biogenesis protein CcmH/NrfG
LEDIMALRAFARAVQAYQSAQRLEGGPDKDRIMHDPLVRLAQEFEFAPLIERQRRADGG